MSRTVGLLIVLAFCTGCPAKWQRAQRVENASAAMRSFYQLHPEASVTNIDVVPSQKAPRRYRIRFTAPDVHGPQTIEVESDGTVGGV